MHSTLGSRARAAMLLSLLAAGCGRQAPQVVEYAVDGDQTSPAFVTVADIDRDGQPEVLVTTLMEQVVPPGPGGPPQVRGALHVYDRADATAPLDRWSERTPFGLDRGLGFINLPQVGDFNGDGVPDVALNTGFHLTGGGTQQYLVGPDLSQAVPFVPGSAQSPFYFHELRQADLDGDGDLDVLTTRTRFARGPAGPPTYELAIDWYRHDGHGGYEAYEIDTGHGGVTLTVHDVDGDGDQDIVTPQFFGPPQAPSLVWLEQLEAPASSNGFRGRWEAHPIDATIGPGFDAHFYDLDGDGVVELVASNHANQNNPRLAGIPSGVYAFAVPADPRSATQWARTTITEGFQVTAPDGGNPESQGSPGLLDVADVTGNGRLDIVTAGDGADGLFLVLQDRRGAWHRVQLADGPIWGQARFADIDGDGRLEVVAVRHGHRDATGTLPPGKVVIFKLELNAPPGAGRPLPASLPDLFTP